MRWVCWISVLAATLGLVAEAMAGDDIHGHAVPCVGCSHGLHSMYTAPACCMPYGFGGQPGCCECQPHCCDNVWDGYCQERARWQACFARIGTRHGCHGRCGGCGYSYYGATVIMHKPTPVALPAEPAPR
jgi:hypothetical protein